MLNWRKFSLRPVLFSSFHTSLSQHAALALPMPALSPTMTSGTIGKWVKQVGDKIEPGDVICEVVTDKATLEFESQQEGYLAQIIRPSGSENVPIGKIIGILVEKQPELNNPKLWEALEQKAKQETSSPAPSSTPSPQQQQQQQSQPQQKPQQSQQPQQKSSRSSSEYKLPLFPSVRLLLHEYDINPFDVKGTIRGGRLTKGDVLAHIKQLNLKPKEKTTQPSTTEPTPQKSTASVATASTVSSRRGPAYQDIPATQMRKVIANRLLESKQTIPHFYMNIEAQMDNFLAYKQKLQEKGIKVSVNDFIIYAAARALQQVPECNAVFNKTSSSHQIANTIDISVAVATEGGLITPIVKNANRLSLEEISKTVKDLGTRAKSNQLKPEEFQGGSFCISNLGMFGIQQFEAVINPPQAVILSVGTSMKKPIVVKEQYDAQVDGDFDDWISKSGGVLSQVSFGTFTSFTVNCDQRAVDQSIAAKYLQTLKEIVEMKY